MKISHLIFISILAILSLFALTTYINFQQWKLAAVNTDYFSTSTENVRITNRFQKNILYMGLGLRGYLTTGDKYFLLTYDSAKVENTAIIKELSDLVSSNRPQLNKFNEIHQWYSQWVNEFAEPLRNQKTPSYNNTKKFASKPFFSNDTVLRKQEEVNAILKGKFKELLNIEYDNRNKAKLALEESVVQTKKYTSALTLLSMAIGLVIAIVLARHVSRQIKKMSTVQNTVAEATFSGIKTLLPMLFEGRGEVSPKVKEHLEAIKARIYKSHVLIEGILTYAGIGKELQPKEEVDVKALVNEVLQGLPVKLGLYIQVHDDLPVLFSEKVALSQVFFILIKNAIKYHNKPAGKIQIYCKEQSSCYEFFVEDDGPGIEKPLQEKIFDIVQTGHNTNALENTGVGLLIVKKILDTRKERIKMVSEPGKGSIFSFTWSKNNELVKKKKHHAPAGILES